jgi:hypothetical protein
MAMNILDMSAVPDLMGMRGNGQITLADLVGTVFSPSLPNGMAPRTHTLLALASLPVLASPPDPSSDFGMMPAIHGCNIYNALNLPGPDGDGGIVAMNGFNTATTIAFDGNGSPQGPPAHPIACKRVPPPGGVGGYVCYYPSMASPDSGPAGMPTEHVIYPMMPYNVVLKANPGTVVQNIPPPQGWPYSADACMSRYVPNAQDPSCSPDPANCTTLLQMCEQQPILPFGVAQIAEANTGGADYPATQQTLGNGGGTDGGMNQFPGPLYIISVMSGAMNITGTDPVTKGPSLSMADGAIDKTKDLTISFSCDGSTTAGSGCTGSGDLTALLMKVGSGTKTMFGASTVSGVGQCAQPVAGDGAITIKATQLAAMIGGQTGSIELSLARLAIAINTANAHPLVFTAGMGVFGFTNQ